MTPRAGVRTTPAIETRLQGAPDPKRGPLYFPQSCLKNQESKLELIHSAGDGDFGLAEHVAHLRFAQA
jgi:hypothetical protein